MKVLIASDIHGRLKAARHLEDLIRETSPDRVVLLGDFLYNGPRNGVPDDYDPMAVALILKKFAPMMLAVRGNCDSRVDEMVLGIKLEDSRVVRLNGYRCDLIHGDLLTGSLLSVQRGDVLMFGHTHVFMLKEEDGVVYLNPGSISFPKNGNPPTYAFLERNCLEIRNFETSETIASLELR